MPADDYTAAVSGGLKLKNVRSSSKISKSHKKKRSKPSQPESSANGDAEKPEIGANDHGGDGKVDQDDGTVDKSEHVVPEDSAATSPSRAGKTEAELRHEERRRKRVCRCHISPSPKPSPRRSLTNNLASARRAPQARRHQDAQRARGRTEPLPQQSK